MKRLELLFIRTDPGNLDFLELVMKLDAELAERDGPQHGFYHQFNGIEDLDRVVLGIKDGLALCCGALKGLDADVLEVKRMYTVPEYRGRGLAGRLLHELEQWAVEDGYDRIVLETGRRQPEAIGLYQKHDYIQTENYGPYKGIENSVCFEKKLN